MKVLKIGYYSVIVLFIAWFLLSWLEIGFHNCDSGHVYHHMNLLMMAGGWN